MARFPVLVLRKWNAGHAVHGEPLSPRGAASMSCLRPDSLAGPNSAMFAAASTMHCVPWPPEALFRGHLINYRERRVAG